MINSINQVKIRKKVFQNIQKKILKVDPWAPDIYLCGLKRNIVEKIVPIDVDRYNGCEWMPGIKAEEYIKAYIKLNKQGYKPAGLLRILNEEHEKQLITPKDRSFGVHGPVLKYCGDFLISVSSYTLKAEHYNTSTRGWNLLGVRITHK